MCVYTYSVHWKSTCTTNLYFTGNTQTHNTRIGYNNIIIYVLRRHPIGTYIYGVLAMRRCDEFFVRDEKKMWPTRMYFFSLFPQTKRPHVKDKRKTPFRHGVHTRTSIVFCVFTQNGCRKYTYRPNKNTRIMQYTYYVPCGVWERDSSRVGTIVDLFFWI